MDTILDFHEKNLVDTPALTHIKSGLRPCLWGQTFLYLVAGLDLVIESRNNQIIKVR